jgi:hypothetical protein
VGAIGRCLELSVLGCSPLLKKLALRRELSATAKILFDASRVA